MRVYVLEVTMKIINTKNNQILIYYILSLLLLSNSYAFTKLLTL